MRIVGEVEHPIYKISILQHMGKFTVKIESDATSQSYKIRESETIQTAHDVKKLITPIFLQKIDKVFLDLSDNLIHMIQSSQTSTDSIKMIDDII